MQTEQHYDKCMLEFRNLVQLIRHIDTRPDLTYFVQVNSLD